MKVSIFQSVEVLDRTKQQRKGELTLCLNWAIHLFLHLIIGAPGSEAFGLGPGLASLAFSLVLWVGLGLSDWFSWV